MRSASLRTNDASDGRVSGPAFLHPVTAVTPAPVLNPSPSATRLLPAAIVYLAGFAASLNVGKLPPSLPVLQQSLGMSLVQASLLVSAFQVAGMCLGMFGGLLADRFGARRVMACGLAVLAAASALGATAGQASTLLACRALESAGFILTVLPGPVLLRRVVPPQRMSVMLGVWGSYMPAGMVTALLATPWLMQAAGWQAAWWVAAVAVAAVCALLLWLVPPDGAAAGGAPVRIGTLARETLAAPGPWLLALAFGLYAGQWMVVFSFLPTIYQAAGIAPATAASLSALGVAVNLVGNVASGALLHRGVSRAAMLAAGALTMGAGAWVAFGSGWPFAWQYGAVLAFSCVGGLIPGSLFTATPRFAPHAGAVSTTTGMMQQGSNIGQFLTPPAVAAVASASGGWHHTWWVTGAMATACLLVAWRIGRLERRGTAGT